MTRLAWEMRCSVHSVTIVALLLATGTCSAFGQSERLRDRRVRPPRWDESMNRAFFPNALERLVGDPPNWLSPDVNHQRAPTSPKTATVVRGTWEHELPADVIEDEIKSSQRPLTDLLASPARFKDGGFRDVERSLHTLTVLFAIITEYDGDVRWKDDAANAVAAFGSAAALCQEPTDAAYAAARQASEDLVQLIQGESLPADNKSGFQLAEIAKLTPLMQRMDEAVKTRIEPNLSSSDVLQRESSTIHHEATLIAALSKWIQREQYGFVEDDTFKSHATVLTRYSLELSQAAQSGNYDSASVALGRIRQACDACHADYR
jgi:hypothetical protein